MKSNLIYLLIIIASIGQLCGQIAKNVTIDTVNTKNDKYIIDEYFKRQRNLALQFEDTSTKIKKNEAPILDSNAKSKFIILCFNLSKSYEEEISSLNKIAKEYERYLSSIVIKADDLDKYKEIFNIKEFKSIQNFISNKSNAQKQSTSFPVILILNKKGQVLNAWSGDKSEDGLKKEDYYAKIKAGLKTIQQEN